MAAGTPLTGAGLTPPAAPDHRMLAAYVPWDVPSSLAGWLGAFRMPAADPAAEHPMAPYCRRRRRALSARFPGEAVVVAAGVEPVRANDVHHLFRPSSEFYWLTGVWEPGAVLALWPDGDGHRAVVYVEPRIEWSSADLLGNAHRSPLWVGERPPLRSFPVTHGIEARPLECLDDDGRGATVVAGDRLRAEVARLRVCKDEFEVEAMRTAVAATVRAFHDIAGDLDGAVRFGERWVEGTFARRARAEGNGTGYPPICAAGARATTLHYTRNDGPVRRGDLLLVDAGVEGPYLYTADLTRTLPVGGSFSAEQRRVYEVVVAAHHAALAAAAPGAPFLATHRAATEVLAAGLVELGVGVPKQHASASSSWWRRYTLHSVSHHIGMDVHDCTAAPRDDLYLRPLEPGMVVTVEPGLYFHENDASVPPALRGIGVRIEDNVLVTDDGIEVLSSALPVEADDVEAWVGRS